MKQLYEYLLSKNNTNTGPYIIKGNRMCEDWFKFKKWFFKELKASGLKDNEPKFNKGQDIYQSGPISYVDESGHNIKLCEFDDTLTYKEMFFKILDRLNIDYEGLVA